MSEALKQTTKLSNFILFTYLVVGTHWLIPASKNKTKYRNIEIFSHECEV